MKTETDVNWLGLPTIDPETAQQIVDLIDETLLELEAIARSEKGDYDA